MPEEFSKECINTLKQMNAQDQTTENARAVANVTRENKSIDKAHSINIDVQTAALYQQQKDHQLQLAIQKSYQQIVERTLDREFER